MLARNVVEFGEDASFLWEQRDRAATSPRYTYPELARLDQRLEASLDGLRLAPVAQVHASLRRHSQLGEASGAFVMAHWARATEQYQHLANLLDTIASHPTIERGVASGMAWGSWLRAERSVRALVRSRGQPIAVRLGLRVARLHRRDLGDDLDALLDVEDETARAAWLRYLGELRPPRYGVAELGAEPSSGEARLWFWRARARIGLSADSIEPLWELARGAADRVARRAIAMAVHLDDPAAVLSKLTWFAQQPPLLVRTLTGVMVTADLRYGPWLLDIAEGPAGEARSLARLVLHAWSGIAFDDVEAPRSAWERWLTEGVKPARDSMYHRREAALRASWTHPGPTAETRAPALRRFSRGV